MVVTCFNTLYVIGSTPLQGILKAVLSGFNTLYVIGSREKILFNISWPFLFQYIICNRFNYFVNLLWSSHIRFNTLYVIGSKSEAYLQLISNTFQYIICNRFKQFDKSSPLQNLVSIHYM